MADTSIINVNGTDYNIKDTLSRERSATAIQKITGDDTIEVTQSSTTRTLTVPLAVTLTRGGKTAVSADAIIDYLEEHGLSITIDSALSETSENPVQNKVITSAINGKENAFTVLGKAKGGTGYASFDDTPTQGSQKAVTSGGVYNALTKIANGKRIISFTTRFTNITLATAWGNLFISNPFSINISQYNFTNAPMVFIYVAGDNDAAIAMSGPTSSKEIIMWLARGVLSETPLPYTVNVLLIEQ